MNITQIIENLKELDWKRTQGKWHNWPYTYNVGVLRNEDELEKFLEQRRNFEKGIDTPWLECPIIDELVSVGGDSGSTFSSEPYAGKGMKKEDRDFIAAAPQAVQTLITLDALVREMVEALELSSSVDWALEEIPCVEEHHIGGNACTHCLLEIDKENRLEALTKAKQLGYGEDDGK